MTTKRRVCCHCGRGGYAGFARHDGRYYCTDASRCAMRRVVYAEPVKLVHPPAAARSPQP